MHVNNKDIIKCKIFLKLRPLASVICKAFIDLCLYNIYCVEYAGKVWLVGNNLYIIW